MRLDRQDIDALDREQRVALVNSLSGYRTATLVGTADDNGQTNLAVFNSLVHIGANPPLLGLIFRPDSVERHTLTNLRASGVYTINHVREEFLAEAHQTSARYPKEVSEFEAVGLTAQWEEGFAAPYVSEAQVRLGLRLCEELSIQANGTYLVIGEIQSLELPDSAVTENGALDPVAAGSVAVTGLSSYFRGEAIVTLPYAKIPPEASDPA